MIELKLKDLLKEIRDFELRGSAEVDVTELTSNSKKVKKGAAFFCIRGTKADGHEFVEEAINRGASVIVCERKVEAKEGITQVLVSDSRLAYSLMSAAFFGHPSRYLKLIGVTGTNGKTTTTHLIEGIFKSAGYKTGLIGTVYCRIVDSIIPVSLTTPDPFELQSILKTMKENGVEVAAMEVSSHAIDQKRVSGVDFEVLAFTNLSRDHLDYHETMENYARAKMKLFEENPDVPWVVNLDDSVGKALLEKGKRLGADVVTYGIQEEADFVAEDIVLGLDNVKFKLKFNDDAFDARINIAGMFNVYNALAASACCYILGLPLEEIVAGLEKSKGAPGRFEIFKSEEGFYAVVDYAHTPDGLENVIESCKTILRGKGRLITVFGCGGDRDREKRPLMGNIASEKSDIVIVTSDNPRSEDPEAIINDILSGVRNENKNKVKVEVDRRKAIELAISMAERNDIVLVAGKGHETYQIFKDRTIYFNDREVVEEAIKKRTETHASESC